MKREKRKSCPVALGQASAASASSAAVAAFWESFAPLKRTRGQLIYINLRKHTQHTHTYLYLARERETERESE